MLYSVKIVSRNGNTMLNMCDSELLGKTISDGKLVMKISKNYYHDQFVEQEEAKDLLKKSNNINLVGNETISLSLELGIGTEQAVKLIDKIPFLIIIKMWSSQLYTKIYTSYYGKAQSTKRKCIKRN